MEQRQSHQPAPRISRGSEHDRTGDAVRPADGHVRVADEPGARELPAEPRDGGRFHGDEHSESGICVRDVLQRDRRLLRLIAGVSWGDCCDQRGAAERAGWSGRVGETSLAVCRQLHHAADHQRFVRRDAGVVSQHLGRVPASRQHLRHPTGPACRTARERQRRVASDGNELRGVVRSCQLDDADRGDTDHRLGVRHVDRQSCRGTVVATEPRLLGRNAGTERGRAGIQRRELECGPADAAECHELRDLELVRDG